MRLYHRTDAHDEILANGFRDSSGTYMTGNVYTGVWFSDSPLSVNEGAVGEALLSVETGDTPLDDWEWVEEEKLYREWLVPAEVANQWEVELVGVDGGFSSGSG